MKKVYLKKGRERPILKGHPWIFSGAIENVEGDPEMPGASDVFDSRGQWLARGLFNPKSQIRVRLLTWVQEPIDEAFFGRRIRQAASLRKTHLARSTNAYRLVNGEGDWLAGLVIDRYGEFLICQFITAGMDHLKRTVVEVLLRLFAPRGIFERSEGSVREEEGLLPAVGVLAGEEPPESIAIEENGRKFLVDVRAGQKTGFYLDQRDNRVLLASLARDRLVLNCFAYSGAFSVYALSGGARKVLTVESSRLALSLAERNLALNGFAVPAEDLIKADAFSYLKACATPFDIVVLDPPALAQRRSDLASASGAYKFLNLHALRLLNPAGHLLTFCCSQHLSWDLFQKILFAAGVDAGRKVQLLKRLGHPVDHPASLNHPEGEYLKGYLLGVLE